MADPVSQDDKRERIILIGKRVLARVREHRIYTPHNLLQYMQDNRLTAEDLLTTDEDIAAVTRQYHLDEGKYCVSKILHGDGLYGSLEFSTIDQCMRDYGFTAMDLGIDDAVTEKINEAKGRYAASSRISARL